LLLVRTGLFICLVAAVLVAAGPAAAKIEIQRGMAGLELRMTKAQVRAKLGTPTKVRTGKNDFGTFTEFTYPRVVVLFQNSPRATTFRTFSPLERTTRGIGVGSTEAEVKAKVPHVTCRTESSFRHCFVGKFLPGHVVTDFQIRHGKVMSAVVGYVVD
jgi:hypothetical protein